MPTPRRITDELLDLARDLIAAGVTTREAVAALECVDSTLRRYGLRDDPELTRQRRAEHARSLNKRWTPDLIVAAINAWGGAARRSACGQRLEPGDGATAGQGGPS